MRWQFWIPLLLCSPVLGREWKSLATGKTLEADFLGLKDGRVALQAEGTEKALVLPLQNLSLEDQAFAELAQISLHGSRVLGPQTFEIQTVVEGGYMARMGSRATPKSPWTFTGEFFFMPMSGRALERGERLEDQWLFYAGNRTWVPLDGDPTVLRAFDVDLDEAVNSELRLRAKAAGDATKLTPLVAEPLIEVVSRRGLALPLGKGYFLTELALLKDAKTQQLHDAGKDYPFQILHEDTQHDWALLHAELEKEGLRFYPRQAPEVGNDIFTLSFSLSSTRRKLSTPSLTRGIVSKVPSANHFQHDASVDADCIGGLVCNEKWELIGLFFQGSSRVESPKVPSSGTPLTPEPKNSALRSCLQSTELKELLLKMDEKPSATAKPALPPLPSIKIGSLGTNAEEVIQRLRQQVVLIHTTHEIVKANPGLTKKTAAPGGAAVTHSLSDSGTRHNSRCRYFNAQKACTAQDGKPCKVCGG